MKIGFVGAWGYGNIGDETYPIVFRKYIKNHNLVFLNSDIDPKCMEDIDVLVMGGGGIIYCNESHHFQYMQWYMDKAMAKGIPLCFISVGIQRFNGNANFLTMWKPYFDYASVISIRSKKGQEMIKEVTTNKHVYYYPDLCYLFRSEKHQIMQQESNIVIIPARKMIADNEEFREWYADNRWVESNYSILHFGSPIDAEVTNEKIKGFKDLIKECNVYDHMTPEENYNIIRSADEIFTGRYHGIVFALSAGFEPSNIHFDKEGFKFENEDLNQDITKAKYHIDILDDIIKQVDGNG